MFGVESLIIVNDLLAWASNLWPSAMKMARTGFDEVFLMASHVSTLDSRKRVRRTFGQLEEVTNMPNLIDVQRSSYDTFLQMGVLPHERTDHGLQETFKSVFPIGDFAGRSVLEFVSYELEIPKYDVEL